MSDSNRQEDKFGDEFLQWVSKSFKYVQAGKCKCPGELCWLLGGLTGALACGILNREGDTWKVAWDWTSDMGKSLMKVDENLLSSVLENNNEGIHETLTKFCLNNKGYSDIPGVKVPYDSGELELGLFAVSALPGVFPLAKAGESLLLVLLQPEYLFPYYRTKGIGEKLATLKSLARSWVSWADLHCQRIEQIVKRLDSIDDENDFEDKTRELEESLNALEKIIPFRHLVVCANSFAKARRNLSKKIEEGKDVVPLICDFLDGLVNRINEKWHQRLSDGCPPCDGPSQEDRMVGGSLVRLALWRDIENIDDKEILSENVDGIIDDIVIVANRFKKVCSNVVGKVKCGNVISGQKLKQLLSIEILESVLHKHLQPWTSPEVLNLVGSGEAARYLSSAVRCCQNNSCDLPKDWKIIDSFAWLLAQYCHLELGIEPRIDIYNHIYQMMCAEPGLHVLEPFYRDHFEHTIEVCALGRMFLATAHKATSSKRIEESGLWGDVASASSSGGIEESRLWEDVASASGLGSMDDVLRQWYLAALLHDIGYGMNLFLASKRLLTFLKNSEALDDFCSKVDDLVEKLSKKVGEDFGYNADQAPGKDHGILGASHIRGLVENIKKIGEPENYEHAIMAIALHNHEEKKVRFDSEPLAFLLVLVDTLQEWNRARFNFSTVAPEFLASIGGSGSSLSGQRTVIESSKTNLKCDFNEDGLIARPEPSGPIWFEFNYNDSINRNAGVFNVWLGMTSSFQRLVFGEFPFDVYVKIRTPMFRRPGYSKPVPNLHRLRDAAVETNMIFLKDWFPNSEDSNQPVAYTSNDAEHTETLTLNLRLLSERRPFGAPMELFRDRLKRWRLYGEDRDFTGNYTFGGPG